MYRAKKEGGGQTHSRKTPENLKFSYSLIHISSHPVSLLTVIYGMAWEEEGRGLLGFLFS